jgi:hypothetical protein
MGCEDVNRTELAQDRVSGGFYEHCTVTSRCKVYQLNRRMRRLKSLVEVMVMRKVPIQC